MKGLNSAVFILVIVYQVLYQIEGSCLLDLNKDFGLPTPVLISRGKYLEPNTKDGHVSFRNKETLLIACPGTRNYLSLDGKKTNIKSVEGYCVSGTTFRIGQWEGSFKDVKCSTQPWTTSEDKGPCYEGHTTHEIGYEIQGEFYPVYSSCFNPTLYSTLYSIHEVTPARKFIQIGRRPSFVEGGLFNKISMNDLYSSKNQVKVLDQLLGEGHGKEYVTKGQFLNRGHLAPRADFPFMTTQRATFHYVNAAPQWNKGNAGDWAALEEAIRRRVHDTNTTVTIFTGTHSVMTLPNADNRPTEIYLDTDDNNNGIVPVPMYFYKLVHDPSKRTASAFVSINSQFYDKSVTDELTFCSDICEGNPNYNWLKWRPRDGTHSFCCDYEEFIEKIDYLPELNVVENKRDGDINCMHANNITSCK